MLKREEFRAFLPFFPNMWDLNDNEGDSVLYAMQEVDDYDRAMEEPGK